LDAIEDVYSKLAPVIYSQDPQVKSQGLEKINSEVIPHWVNLIEKRIEKYGKGYSIGDHLTIADLKLNSLFGSILRSDTPYFHGILVDPIKKAPKLLEILNKVTQHPKIVEWNNKHNQK
jgi:glutathionyl-hydroquinone reductase